MLATTLFLLTTLTQPRDSLVVIRSLTITGNQRTRERIIRRELDMQPGDTLSRRALREKLAWDQRKIANTNLFITVDLTAREDTLAPEGPAPVDLSLAVRERWYLFALPTFYLADRNFNEWWYERGRDLRRTIYGGRMSYKNVTGNNDKLRAVLETGFVRRADLSYTLPYIDRALKTGLSVGVAYMNNKEIAYRSALDKLVYVRDEDLLRDRFYANAVLTRRNRFFAFHRFESRYVRYNVADTIARLNPDYLLDGRKRLQYLQLSYSYTYDRRDNVAYPLSGRWYTLSASQYGLLPGDNLRQTEFLGSVERFWPLGKRFYASNYLSGKWSGPTRQPYVLLRGLGYTQDLIRGYELYVIDGQRYGLVKNTLRYQLLNTQKQFNWVPIRQFNTVPLALYLTAFADAGYVSSSVAREYNSRLANQLLYGGGIGLDAVTFYNAVFRFSFAYNRQGQTGFFFTYVYDL